MLGREIPILILGNDNATKQVWVDGAIHGREYMTQPGGDDAGGAAAPNIQGGGDVRLAECAVSYCADAQPGRGGAFALWALSVADPARKLEILAINRGSEDFTRYKANANGVDLNPISRLIGSRRNRGICAGAGGILRAMRRCRSRRPQAVAQYIQRRLDASVFLSCCGRGDLLVLLSDRRRAGAGSGGGYRSREYYGLYADAEEDSLSGAG